VSPKSLNLLSQVGALLNDFCFLDWEACKPHPEAGSHINAVGSKLQGCSRTQQGITLTPLC